MQEWIGLIGALIRIWTLRNFYIVSQNMTIGTKTTQFLAVVFVLPLPASIRSRPVCGSRREPVKSDCLQPQFFFAAFLRHWRRQSTFPILFSPPFLEKW